MTPVLLFLAGYAVGVALAQRRQRRRDAQLYELLRPRIHNLAPPSAAELHNEDPR
jgi:hypothetical protein